MQMWPAILLAFALLAGESLAVPPQARLLHGLRPLSDRRPGAGLDDVSVPRRRLPGRRPISVLHVDPPPPPRHGFGTRKNSQSFDQRRDHFNPTDRTTFKQFYFTNPSYKSNNGLVFLWINGESASSGSWVAKGLMHDVAKINGANMFELEHRYYGYSRPTNDTKSESLRWLTSDQALADVAYFIQTLKRSGEIASDAQVFVFGASYSGSLAAWARLKYPHLISGAVSSSGPILAKVDFKESYEVVAKDVTRYVGDWCTENIRKAFRKTQELTATEEGRSTVLKTYSSCSNFNFTNAEDLQNFYSYLAFPWLTMAQKYVGNNEHSPFPSYCGHFSGQTLTDLEAMQGLASLFLFVYNLDPTECMDFTYESSIESEKQTAWDVAYAESRIWYYQTCVQFGFYQTDDSENQPFGNGLFPVEEFVKQCQDIFGEKYDLDLLEAGVKNTNRQYGGRDPDVTRVVFVNGDVDPWHTLGRTTNLNSQSPAVLISGASHGNDVLSPSTGDSAELVAGRQRVTDLLSSMIYDQQEE